MPSTNVSVTILKSYRDTYAFLSDPRNLPKWAHGLVTAIDKVGGKWVAETPFGSRQLTFCDFNDNGVVDHWVSHTDGTNVNCPMRCLKNGDGRDVLFTVFQQAYMDPARYESAIKAVTKDLANLKILLESV